MESSVNVNISATILKGDGLPATAKGFLMRDSLTALKKSWTELSVEFQNFHN
jgi:hypothetical protein